MGLGLTIDPTLTKADNMVGQVVTSLDSPEKPPVFCEAILTYTFLENDEKAFSLGELLRLNCGSAQTGAKIKRIIQLKKGVHALHVELGKPLCAEVGSLVAITRKNKEREWTLAAGGVIQKIKKMPLFQIGRGKRN